MSSTTDTTRYRYNASRQVVGVIGPDPDGGGSLKHRAVRITYDGGGRPTDVEYGTVNSQSDGDWATMAVLQEVEQDYDANHRPVVQRLESGGTAYALTQTSYDDLGRVQCVAQRMNPSEFGSLPADACTQDTPGSFGPDRIARTTYDAAGQVTLLQTGYGVSSETADEVETTYTDNGRVATAEDANGNRTTYEYDGHDRLVKTRMPSPTTPGTSSTTDYEQLTLDANGNVTNRRLRDNTNIAYSYDNLNRLTGKNLPGSTPDPTYGYDLLGRMTSSSLSGYAITYTYDALSRNFTQASPFGTLTSTWDAAGRRTRLNYGGGLYVDYDHLVTGEVTAIRENGATSGAGVLGTYAYDDLGRRTSLTRGNGTVTSFGYDAVSRLTSLTQNLNGTGSDVTFGYSHNPAGEIVSTTRSNDAYAYTGHVNGNVANTINGLNQVTATGGSSVSHDARGNVTAIGGSSYTYTPENRLSHGPNSSLFAYDALGRLYYAGTPSGVYLQPDGDSIAAEIATGGGPLQRRYVHAPGIDEPLVWYEGTGTSDRRWFHADERGSVVAVSDGNGDLIGSNPNRYDAYGAPQGTVTGRFGYTGQAWLPEAGLWYYRARMYNPGLGRFMQTDPIGYRGGMNLYAYVGNNPVNFTDPSGLCRFTMWGHFEATQGPDGQPSGPWKLMRTSVTQDSSCDSPGFGNGGNGGEGGGQHVIVTGSRGGSPQFQLASAAPNQLRRPCFTIQQHRENHDRWVARQAARLRAAGYQVATEVSISVWTPDRPTSVLARADIVARIPGSRYYIINEIKTGDAGLSRNQTVVYNAEFGVINGVNGIPIGLPPGSFIDLANFAITRCPGL